MPKSLKFSVMIPSLPVHLDSSSLNLYVHQYFLPGIVIDIEDIKIVTFFFTNS